MEEDALNRGIEQNTNKTIINMLNNNLDLETISKCVNKSIDEIKDIKKSLNN